MSEITERRYLGAREVAERLGVGVTTIYRLIQKEQFPEGARFGKSHRWDIQDVDAWAAAQAQADPTRERQHGNYEKGAFSC